MNTHALLEEQLAHEHLLLQKARGAIFAAESVEAYLRAKQLRVATLGQLSPQRCTVTVMVEARFCDLTNALEHAGATYDITYDSNEPWLQLRHYRIEHQGHPVSLVCMPPAPQPITTTPPPEPAAS